MTDTQADLARAISLNSKFALECERLRASNKQLREALQFYADRQRDGGEKARATLERLDRAKP